MDPWFSFIQKHVALNDFMNEYPNTITLFARAREYVRDLRPVRELNGRTGGIDEQLLDEVTGQLFVLLEQQLFELADILESPAAGQFAAGIDPRANAEMKIETIMADAFERDAAADHAVA